jgi:hypothetical protein
MSKADISTTPIRSRRAFLAGMSIAAAMPIVAAVPATTGAALVVDPIFVALDAFRLAEAEFYAERSGDIPDEIGDRWSEAMDVVIRTQPTTPAGLGALTGFARDMAERSNRDAGLPDGGWILVMAAIDDATRGMSGLEPWSPPPAATPIPLGPHPDAELFAAAERYLSALSEYANSALAFGDVEFIKPRPRGYVSRKRAYHRTMNHFGTMEAELVTIRAKTLDGLLAKARALEADRNVSEALQESILNDLIGMAPGTGKAVA